VLDYLDFWFGGGISLKCVSPPVHWNPGISPH
jgi:hypothetical protein